MVHFIVDTHCDALLKLWENPNESFYNSKYIDTNVMRLKRGKVKVQFFAIFVEPWIKQEQKFSVALEQVKLFHEKVLRENRCMRHIRKWSELEALGDDEIGAVLTLEGADAIGDDLTKLEILYTLGVLSVGMTWNEANLCADGVGEPRGAGLTQLGKKVVRLNNKHHVLTDVSHLSEEGFWDVMEEAKYPIASHSNARALCEHPRNLYDHQVEALIDKNGFIGLVFYPLFLTGKKEATISHVLHHLEHMCELGGGRHVGFGSDFDGISDYVERLRHSAHYEHLVNELLKHYSEESVRGFLGDNMRRILLAI